MEHPEVLTRKMGNSGRVGLRFRRMVTCQGLCWEQCRQLLRKRPSMLSWKMLRLHLCFSSPFPLLTSWALTSEEYSGPNTALSPCLREDKQGTVRSRDLGWGGDWSHYAGKGHSDGWVDNWTDRRKGRSREVNQEAVAVVWITDCGGFIQHDGFQREREGWLKAGVRDIRSI